jgi:4-aminobutyrate aminotransferase-like enzyme
VFGKKTQVSGICVSEKYSEILYDVNQKLNVTFDGDVMDMLRGTYVLKAIRDYNLLENVINFSSRMKSALSSSLSGYRSIGSLIAFDFDTTEKRNAFFERCYQGNLLVNKTGEKSIRLRPNLALSLDVANCAISDIRKNLYC